MGEPESCGCDEDTVLNTRMVFFGSENSDQRAMEGDDVPHCLMRPGGWIWQCFEKYRTELSKEKPMPWPAECTTIDWPAEPAEVDRIAKKKATSKYFCGRK
jgi:hypothetical protein